MHPQEVYERRAEFTFVDVREWYEWEAGSVAGALHIPIRQIPQRFSEIPREPTVVVVCQIGQRSDLVSQFLRQQGYEAHNLEGGLEAWSARGLPLTTDHGEQGTIAEGWAQGLPASDEEP